MPTGAVLGLIQPAGVIFRVQLLSGQWWSEDESVQNIIQKQLPPKIRIKRPFRNAKNMLGRCVCKRR